MNPATWTAVRMAFAEVSEAAPAECGALLAALAPDVRAEVESLLAAHEESRGFIERDGPPSPTTESRLGPYRLLEKLGEGGMGVVFRAERDDGEYRRQVAIKITGGRLFAAEAERRFLHERQILAQLEHPHIVRMLDGGVDQGRRYLVMEYVEGQPISEFCAGRSESEKLQLFRQVCGAIQYAHQNLVIHRDLKAANILVTRQGEAKVLDFGIAKLMDDEYGATTLFQPMSLRCASPEQARGERVTAATDIYALGLLLYEMLSGRNPHDPREGETREALLRRIMDEDPPPPGAGDDLNAVVMKALDRDPARRYASAAELAEEIRRYLAGDGVLARLPSAWQRLRRAASRHRLATALAAALTVALVAGTLAVAWQARVARQQRELAERRFAEARRLIRTVVQEVQPRLANINGTLQTRRMLLEAATTYFERLTPELEENPSLAAETIIAYQLLARATGSVNTANVGDMQAGESLRKKGVALAESALRRHPDHRELLRAAVRILGDQPGETQRRRAVSLAERMVALQPGEFAPRDGLAFASFQLAAVSQGAERISGLERALAIWQQELNRRPKAVELLRNIGLAHKNLAAVGPMQSRLDHALQAQAMDERLQSLQPESPMVLLDLAMDLSMVSTAYRDRGDAVQALEYMRRSVALREKVVAANPDDIRALDRLAYAWIQVGELATGSDAAQARQRGLALVAQLSRRSQPSGQTQGWAARAALALAEQATPERRCALARQATHWLLVAGKDPVFSRAVAQAERQTAACAAR